MANSGSWPKETCGQCKWAVGNDDPKNDIRECCVLPPTVIFDGSDQDVLSIRPLVNVTDSACVMFIGRMHA